MSGNYAYATMARVERAAAAAQRAHGLDLELTKWQHRGSTPLNAARSRPIPSSGASRSRPRAGGGMQMPIAPQELDDLRVTLYVPSNFERCMDPNDWVLGLHGVLVRYFDPRRARRVRGRVHARRAVQPQVVEGTTARSTRAPRGEPKGLASELS